MTNPEKIRYLSDDDGSLMRRLYLACSRDEAWPAVIRHQANFEQWLTSQEMARWLHDGDYRIIVDSTGAPLGFYTVGRVEDHLNALYPDVVMEAGTYLIEAARGKGLNYFVKEQIRHHAKAVYQATMLVFSMAQTNIRAQRALMRLPYKYATINAGMLNHPWQPLLQRRSFEFQQEVVLYLLDLRNSTI